MIQTPSDHGAPYILEVRSKVLHIVNNLTLECRQSIIESKEFLRLQELPEEYIWCNLCQQ